jgi:hypothetical protein
MQFHIRYISTSETLITGLSAGPMSEGLCFRRDNISLGLRQDFPLIESRVAIAINTTLDEILAYYSMVTLTDSQGLCPDDFEGDQSCCDLKLSFCGGFTGVALFQVAICHVLREWDRRWNGVLDSISNILKVPV